MGVRTMSEPYRDPPPGLEGGLVKVMIELPRAEWHKHGAEWLWAEHWGMNLYRLRNTPLYAEGFSYGDVVEARPVEGGFIVQRVARRGGHSTYVFLLSKEAAESHGWPKFWQPLEELGCRYESRGRLYAVDVPPEVDVHKAYQLLEAGEKAGVWGFQEQHYGHPRKQ